MSIKRVSNYILLEDTICEMVLFPYQRCSKKYGHLFNASNPLADTGAVDFLLK
jgi:hypothetical protein